MATSTIKCEDFNLDKYNYRDGGGITFNCNYIEFGKGVIFSATLNLYTAVNNTVLINPDKLPIPHNEVCFPVFDSSLQNAGYALISNGDMYLCQTLSSGTYYINGSYIK